MMLTLSVLEANRAPADVVTWLGGISLVLVAAIVVGLWVFVGGRVAHSKSDQEQVADEDRELEALSRTRLVVQGEPSGPHAVIESELERTGEPEPPSS